MSKSMKITIKWKEADRVSANSNDLTLVLEEVIRMYLFSHGASGPADISNAIDRLRAKYGGAQSDQR